MQASNCARNVHAWAQLSASILILKRPIFICGGTCTTRSISGGNDRIIRFLEVQRVDHPHVLAALREELDVTSPKDGCSPTGQCGCCAVLLDGKAQVSCQMPLAKAAGREVVTLEGFDDAERDRLADAFAATAARSGSLKAAAASSRRSTATRRLATSAVTCAAAPAT